MAISGKSSSVAALLLLVAVLAGSCATGANANCDVVNNCTLNATLVNVTVAVNASALVDVVVLPGQIATVVGPLLKDLKIVIGGKTYLLLVADIQKLVILDAVAKIEILCNGASPCGKNALTINIYVNLQVLGLFELHLLGSVCALLSIY